MGSDAEYMYEHDLDPLYRKDRSTKVRPNFRTAT